MIKVILHIGSNKEDRQAFLTQAIKLINEKIGTISVRSSIYETEPWGVTDQPYFLNQTLVLRTHLSADDLIKRTKSIEEEMGRDKTAQWGPRNIDIDILTYGNSIIKKDDLEIPHPRIAERNFVLIPLMEVEPDLVLPGFKVPVETLYENSLDECEVYEYEG